MFVCFSLCTWHIFAHGSSEPPSFLHSCMLIHFPPHYICTLFSRLMFTPRFHTLLRWRREHFVWSKDDRHKKMEKKSTIIFCNMSNIIFTYEDSSKWYTFKCQEILSMFYACLMANQLIMDVPHLYSREKEKIVYCNVDLQALWRYPNVVRIAHDDWWYCVQESCGWLLQSICLLVRVTQWLVFRVTELKSAK